MDSKLAPESSLNCAFFSCTAIFEKKRVFFSLFFFLVASCQAPEEKCNLLVFQGTAMTVPYKILVDTKTHSAPHTKIQRLIEATFQEINEIYNKWNPNSEISLFNQAVTLNPIPVSKKLYDFLLLTDFYVHLTQGRFDPTIEPLQNLWKKSLAKGEVPKKQDLQSISNVIGWDKISLKNGCVIKKHPNAQIDFGGIAKGFLVDQLTDKLIAERFENFYVEWGGEIRTQGEHPEGRAWKVYISNLGDADPSRAITYVELNNEAIATSGDYLQQWNGPSETFFHIFDPRTLHPLIATHTSVASVTVKAKTCLSADVLATSTMLFPSVQEASEWSKEVAGTSFWIFSRQKLKQIKNNAAQGDRSSLPGAFESSLRSI